MDDGEAGGVQDDVGAVLSEAPVVPVQPHADGQDLTIRREAAGPARGVQHHLHRQADGQSDR